MIDIKIRSTLLGWALLVTTAAYVISPGHCTAYVILLWDCCLCNISCLSRDRLQLATYINLAFHSRLDCALYSLGFSYLFSQPLHNGYGRLVPRKTPFVLDTGTGTRGLAVDQICDKAILIACVLGALDESSDEGVSFILSLHLVVVSVRFYPCVTIKSS